MVPRPFPRIAPSQFPLTMPNAPCIHPILPQQAVLLHPNALRNRGGHCARATSRAPARHYPLCVDTLIRATKNFSRLRNPLNSHQEPLAGIVRFWRLRKNSTSASIISNPEIYPYIIFEIGFLAYFSLIVVFFFGVFVLPPFFWRENDIFSTPLHPYTHT